MTDNSKLKLSEMTNSIQNAEQTPSKLNSSCMDKMNKLFENCKSINATRVFILFSLGLVIGLVLNILQMEYKTNLLGPTNIVLFLHNTWWVLPSCGIAAGIFLFFMIIIIIIIIIIILNIISIKLLV